MKQVFLRKGKVEVDQVPGPLIEPRYVLVEVAYSLISSGTELAALRSSGQSLAKKAVDNPDKVLRVLKGLQEKGIRKTVAQIREKVEAAGAVGYSCAGVVVQVGEGVTAISPGDCVACAGAGWANHAEMVLVPRNLICRVPSPCTLADAASVTLGAIAMQGVRRAGPKLGESVLVLGLGLIGQLTIQLLRASGCRTMGIDPDAPRAKLATTMGADCTFTGLEEARREVDAFTAGKGFDAVIIAASAPGNDALVRQAADVTCKKGKIVIVGDVGLGLERAPLYEKELDVLMSTSYGPGRYDPAYEERGQDYPHAYVRWTENRNMQAYLQLLADRKVVFSPLVGATYVVEDAAQAYAALGGPGKPLAVLLDYRLEDQHPQSRYATKVAVSSSAPIDEKRRVRVAVVGAGEFARSVLLPNLRELRSLYEVGAIVSSTGGNAKETARRYGARYCSTNLNDVLEDDQIDMVVISTPHHLHAPMAAEAARAGKAIFLEKPMALNSEELDAVARALDETQAPFTVGFNRRFAPASRRAKELLLERRAPAMILYRVNAGHLPAEHWIHGHEGGGRIIGEACHMLDLLRYFIGYPVESVTTTFPSIPAEHIRDNVVATLTYADGSVATLVYTSIGSPKATKEWIEIHCGGLILSIDDFKSLSVFGSSAKGWRGKQDKGHSAGLRAFGTALQEKGPMPIPLDELIETTQTSFIIQQGSNA